MEAVRSIEEMSGSELLDHVDDLSTTQRRCEVEILKAAEQHAVINNPETLDPQLRSLTGRERAKRFGGVGTEAVAEFVDPRHQQIDHTEEYDPGAVTAAGQSRIGNYGPMTGFHHRIKTHGNWDVQQPYPGIYIWRDPHGAYYLVDHTGTRRVQAAA